MKPYKPSTPRAAFAVAAFALTAITAVVSIVVPATLDSGISNPGVLVQSNANPGALAQPNGITPLPVAATRGFEQPDGTADCASSGSPHHVSLRDEPAHS